MQGDLQICRAVLEDCAVFKVPVYGAKGSDDRKATCDELRLTFVEEAYIDTLHKREEAHTIVSAKDIYKKPLSVGRSDAIMNKDRQDLELGFSGAPFSKQFFSLSNLPTGAIRWKTQRYICRKAVDELNAERLPTVG
ncbi:hypothetical protein LARI1_G001725 [Lachnellula arida]|uniref:Uncharacterized protein n=1 Tax=Lachnellula arida TaxID=1316785 RepID=A0A8T9BLU6_9HELO|nr:hypothetical protein LARI1_G001725 [Lachnellula arida]